MSTEQYGTFISFPSRIISFPFYRVPYYITRTWYCKQVRECKSPSNPGGNAYLQHEEDFRKILLAAIIYQLLNRILSQTIELSKFPWKPDKVNFNKVNQKTNVFLKEREKLVKNSNA